MNRATFESKHPGVFFLDLDRDTDLADYLRAVGVMGARDAIVRTEKAGEGNMNCCIRVATSSCSLILKQSRPWVEKYPQFEAPWDRALVEAEFYRRVSGYPPLHSRMPRLLAVDETARLLILEDLGPCVDLTCLYGGEPLDGVLLDDLADFLSALHNTFFESPPSELLRNRSMRQLNSQHIFSIPFQSDEGPDLDSIQTGLQTIATPLQSDDQLGAVVRQLGQEVYLADGPCLLHGDFFPGSILRTDLGPKVIDPEFAFFGRAEFDTAVLLAHLHLAQQPQELVQRMLNRYQAPAVFDPQLMLQLAGVEIIRRLIGFAQLPLRASLDQKADWLSRARNLVLHPDACWLTTA